MNQNQKICLWIGIVVIVTMGLFPPWISRAVGSRPTEELPKYSFLLLPPPAQNLGNGVSRHQIYMTRLVIQWLMVAIVTGGLMPTLADKKPKDEQKE
jgi:hypothetical protein